MVQIPGKSAPTPKKFVPRVPGQGLAGNQKELFSGPPQFYAKAAWQSGSGIARFRVYHREFYVIAHPDLLHKILVTQQHKYIKTKNYRTASMAIGDGLVTIDNKKWANDRPIIQPGFHRKAIAHLVDVVHASCHQVFQNWAENPQRYRNFVPAGQLITQQVISETLLGTTLEAMQDVNFSAIVAESQRLLTRKNWSFFQLPFPWPTPLNRKLMGNRRRLYAVLTKQIEQRQAYGVGKHGDLLDLLLLANTRESAPTLPWERVLGEMLTLFIAGYDTTATGLAWTLYYLCQHPSVATKLRAEIDAVLGQRQATWADLEHLTLTEQVLNEALRLNPPVHTLMRTNLEDEELGGYHIPKGSQLIVSIYGAQRSPEHWHTPEAFRPDRFAPTAPQRIDKRAFIPFGNGERRCLGAMFAMVESKLVIANLIQKFHFSLKPNTEIKVTPSASFLPDQLQVSFTPR